MPHALLAVRVLAVQVLAVQALSAQLLAAVPPVVTVDRDNIVVRESCTLAFAPGPIADTDGNGVVHIEAPADGRAIVVDLGGGTLVGGTGAPDSHAGTGIAITGANITLRNGAVRGFKVGIHAEWCDGLVLEDLDTGGNYAQRLRSTPSAEAGDDWLFPHRNDEGEWTRAHGAGVSVRSARGVTLRRIASHGTQNGIILDRVTDSSIHDNDCSFLSGWGIAMWRSSRNTICRNRLIYCIRGYSHGVYNRGQDSAGLLMFEQCSDNLVALNSITHGGDGVFGFAGREALGEAPCPSSRIDFDDPHAWYRGRGCSANIFARNDLSFAAAHGLEMTFSTGNLVYRNTLEGNAICGIWGGYARDGAIVDNDFRGNGGAGYGLERGGANLEHAQRVRIAGNRFSDEPVSVHLWTDADEGLRALPWAKANGMGAEANTITGNLFTRIATPIELRAARGTRIAANRFVECARELVEVDCEGTVADAGRGASMENELAELATIAAGIEERLAQLPGTGDPTVSRVGTRGRADIVMGEFAPWNHRDLIVVPVAVKRGESLPAGTARFRALGAEGASSSGALEVEARANSAAATGGEALRATLRGEHADGGTVIEVSPSAPGEPRDAGTATPFTLRVRDTMRDASIAVEGVLVATSWSTRIAALDAGDAPRLPDVPSIEDVRRRAASDDAVVLTIPRLDLDRARGGPRQLAPDERGPRLPPDGPDRYCLTATTTIRCAPGLWRLVTESDDGIRVRLDGRTLIERWDIHGPTTDIAEFTTSGDAPVTIEVEYFQNSGAARLSVRLERP